MRRRVRANQRCRRHQHQHRIRELTDGSLRSSRRRMGRGHRDRLRCRQRYVERSIPGRVWRCHRCHSYKHERCQACLANYGTGVELSAPGTSIRTTDLGGGTDIVAGTSFSSSIVAAAAAVTQGGPSELVKLVHSPGLAGQRRVSWFSHVLRVWHAGHRCCRGLLAHGLADRGHPGPTEIKPGATCTWFASTNGTSPYTYSWYNNGGSGGTGSGRASRLPKAPATKRTTLRSCFKWRTPLA